MRDKHFRSFETLYNQHNRDKRQFFSPKRPARNATHSVAGRKRSSRGIWFLVGFLLFAFVIFLVSSAGLFIFQKNNEPKWESERVELKIQGPEEIDSGETVEYSILLENQGEVGLNDAEMAISFPQGFSFISAEPEFSQQVSAGGIWGLDKITSFQKEEMKIIGKLFGEVNDKKVFSLSLSYQPDNFSSTFLDTASCETKIAASLIDLGFELPTEIVSNEEVAGEIDLQKIADVGGGLGKVRVVLEYPYGFKLNESNIENQETERESAAVWLLDNLSTAKSITFKGVLTGEANEKKSFYVKVFLVDEQGNESPVVVEIHKKVTVIAPPVAVNLQINNSTSENQNINFGDSLTYEIQYQNNSSDELEDIALEVDFTGDDLLDWESLEILEDEVSDVGDIEREGKLFFNKFQFAKLEKLAPEESLTIKFKINILDQDKLTDRLDNLREDGKVEFSCQVSSLASKGESEVTAVSNVILLEAKEN